MTENKFETLDLAQLGNYIEEQQLLLVTPMEEGMLGAGINKFRLCGVGPWDLAPGFEFWMDSDLVTTIASGTGIAAAIVAYIPDPTVSKLIAAFFGVLSALFAKAAAQGTGLFIRGAFIPAYPYVTPILICYQS